MPGSMPTLFLPSSFHGRADRLFLRVNVPLGDVHIAVASEIRQRPRVHVWRPSGQTGVPQRVKLEAPELHIFAPGLLAKNDGCLLDRLGVLLL